MKAREQQVLDLIAARRRIDARIRALTGVTARTVQAPRTVPWQTEARANRPALERLALDYDRHIRHRWAVLDLDNQPRKRTATAISENVPEGVPPGWLEDAEFMASTGATVEEAAGRLGKTITALEKQLSRHRASHVWHALRANGREAA